MRVKDYALLALLCLAIFLPGLASVPPLDRDEPRFAEASRQMLESGDFVNIRFQDEPRLKKPVGIYWLQVGKCGALLAGGRHGDLALPPALDARRHPYAGNLPVRSRTHQAGFAPSPLLFVCHNRHRHWHRPE